MKLYALPTFEVLLFCRDSTVSNHFLVRQWYVKLSMFLDKLMFYYSYNTKRNSLSCVAQTSSMLGVKVMLILGGVDANIREDAILLPSLFFCSNLRYGKYTLPLCHQKHNFYHYFSFILTSVSLGLIVCFISFINCYVSQLFPSCFSSYVYIFVLLWNTPA